MTKYFEFDLNKAEKLMDRKEELEEILGFGESREIIFDWWGGEDRFWEVNMWEWGGNGIN